MILLIDNYDSFTYNLAQFLGELGAEIKVVRNEPDQSGRGGKSGAPSHIVISPGPGTPDQAGISLALIKTFRGQHPYSGCLSGPPGHRAGFRRQDHRRREPAARQGYPRSSITGAASSASFPRPSPPRATIRW